MVHVLREDTELGEHLPSERLRLAERVCVARTMRARPGSWALGPPAAAIRHGIGLLVLDGFMTRRAGLGGRFGAELLGAGDLVQPWQDEVSAMSTLPLTSEWRILRPARFALLDTLFIERASRFPEVISALLSRAIVRSRRLAISMAIVHHPRIDVRLHMLLWELADRWGRVHSEGVVHVPVRLTHQVLGELVAAHRPSVTKALHELAVADVLHWDGQAWVLRGGPPGELGELQAGIGAGPVSAASRV